MWPSVSSPRRRTLGAPSMISDWKEDYNHRRRHSALGYQAPAVYAAARTHHDRLSLTAAPMSRASVGGGGCILRAPGGPVDLDRYALRVCSRLDQVKRNVRAAVREQPHALAENHGDDEQDHLVDEVVSEQPADQGAAAVHLQLTPRLAFQLADGSRDVAGEDGRVRPARFGECGRYEVLRLCVQGIRNGVVARIVCRG